MLAKFCGNLLKPIPTNEYTQKIGSHLLKKVEEFDLNIAVASFDIKSIFSNSGKKKLIETIGNFVANVYKNQQHINGLSKNLFSYIIRNHNVFIIFYLLSKVLHLK